MGEIMDFPTMVSSQSERSISLTGRMPSLHGVFVTVCKTNSMRMLKQTKNDLFGTVRGVRLTEGLRSSPDKWYEKRSGWSFPVIGSGEFPKLNPSGAK